jgi:TonB family protein
MSRVLAVLLLGFVFLRLAIAQTTSSSPKIFAPKPKYPRECRQKGITGKGLAILTVDRDTGYVTDAHMLKSTGHKLLDDSALEAFRKWHFKPGTVSPVRAPINFEVQKQSPKT